MTRMVEIEERRTHQRFLVFSQLPAGPHFSQPGVDPRIPTRAERAWELRARI